MINILTCIAISLTTGIVFRYLKKSTQKSQLPLENGQYRLRIHKFYLILGLISFVVGLAMVIGSILTISPDITMYIMIFIMFLVFVGLGTLSILYYRNYYVQFDNSYVEVMNAFGKLSSMRWDEIKTAKFNFNSGLLTLAGNGKRIKIHQHLVGINRFMNYLEKKTGWTAKGLKMNVTIERE